MKTPREILLQRHQSDETKLDAICREVVAEHVIAPQFQAVKETAPAFDLRVFARKLWEELVLPCRRVWVGMAAVWMAILALNVASSGGAPQMAVAKMPPRNPEVMAALREQTQMRLQLLDQGASHAIRPLAPSPRSERGHGSFTA
jgi:hypothetical protein